MSASSWCCCTRARTVSRCSRALRREVPRIVPPRGRMPAICSMPSGTVASSSTPPQPSRKPRISSPCCCADRTTALITALSPGQSPPPVKMPIRIAVSVPEQRAARKGHGRAGGGGGRAASSVTRWGSPGRGTGRGSLFGPEGDFFRRSTWSTCDMPVSRLLVCDESRATAFVPSRWRALTNLSFRQTMNGAAPTAPITGRVATPPARATSS